MVMNAQTGLSLSGIGHIQQSISNILSTPVGSRVMRRDYGSHLFYLIDRPLSDALILQVYAATLIAITRWEPRVRIERFYRVLSTHMPGQLLIDMEIIRLDTGSKDSIRMSVGFEVGGVA